MLHWLKRNFCVAALRKAFGLFDVRMIEKVFTLLIDRKKKKTFELAWSTTIQNFDLNGKLSPAWEMIVFSAANVAGET